MPNILDILPPYIYCRSKVDIKIEFKGDTVERSVIEHCQHHVFISFKLQKRVSTSCKLYPDVSQRFEAGARQNCMAVFTTKCWVVSNVQQFISCF
jgi:hypothetical protein